MLFDKLLWALGAFTLPLKFNNPISKSYLLPYDYNVSDKLLYVPYASCSI